MENSPIWKLSNPSSLSDWLAETGINDARLQVVAGSVTPDFRKFLSAQRSLSSPFTRPVDFFKQFSSLLLPLRG